MPLTLRHRVPLAAGLAMAAATLAHAGDARDRVGLLEISGTPAEAPNPFAWLFGDQEPTLRDLVGAIEDSADSQDLDHLVIRLKDASLGWSHVDELGQAIAKVDVPVTVFAEQMGPTDLMLASYADNVLMQRAGDVSLPGLYMEEMFLADTLDWVGMEAQLIQVGDYKGANEQLTRSGPSEAWDQNISGLLDGLYGHMLTTIGDGRGMDRPAIEASMESLWMAQADDAVRAGLVDRELDLPALAETVAGEDDPRIVKITAGASRADFDTSNPFAIFQLLSREPDRSLDGPTIAVLHLTGSIMTGDSSSGGLFGGQTIGSRSVRNILKELGEEDMVKGVVLRIDSPGGSATASEIIWQGVRELREQKPVWVSVGSMAASGGYYIAVAGEKIYANPSSILGSIGVVGGKISMAELYDELKINVVGRARGPRADIFASDRRWNDDQIALVRGKMVEIYDQFTDRVQRGRAGIDLSKTAEGRLFLGKDAVGLEMADEVGSLDDAVADLAQHVGLTEYDVRPYPGPKSLEQFLDETFGGMASAPGLLAGSPSVEHLPMLRAARAAMGEAAWKQLATALEGFALLRDEHVVLTAPSVFSVR